MDQCGVERENVPSSDCDEDEDENFNLLTVINEHSEVIGLIEDNRDTNSQIGQNGVADSVEIEIFHPPPDNLESDSNETNSLNDNPNGNGDESESDQNNSHGEVNEDYSDSEDQEHYMVYQEEIMALRIILISLKYQLSIMPVLLNTKKILEMVGNGL